MTERKGYLSIVVGILLLVGLYLTSQHSYLLFHGLAEIFGITVAFAIFMLAWNSRRFLAASYLLFVGIAYLFVAGLDLLHTLAYKGMNIFKGDEANLSTQLWVSARYVESVSLLIATVFIKRKLKSSLAFLGYSLVVLLLLLSIFSWGVFPVCFAEESGLTPFKKISEYGISCILLAAIGILLRNRREFDPGVLRLIIASITATVASELAFTHYADVYGLFNLIGHYLKILSFYLIYVAIVETGIRNPYALVFRNLKQHEESLEKARSELEQRVGQRTAELREANIRLTQEAEERRRAEAALRGKERVLAEAQRIAHVGNWDWNIVTNELHWSDEVYRIFGLQPQEFGATYEAFLKCVHPDDRETVKDAVSKALGDSTATYSIEHGVVRGDGSERVVHERGEVTFDEADSPIRMIGTVQDITERKEVEEKLREAELRYRTVADFTYDWVYWENPDVTMRYVSPSCQRITGYDAEEFIANPRLLREIILPEDKGAWEAHRLAAFESPRLREVQFRIRTRNGDIRWIEHNCQPVTDERGAFLGFRASNRDITDRRRAEEDVRRLREELSHVTRVTMMGELAASLAHELNQPLAAILSNAQAAQRFLLGEKPELEEVGKALADIIQDDRRAGGVIRRVRSLLKKGDLGFIPLDMNGLIQEVVALLKGEVAAKKVSLRLELASELPDVSGDRIQLQQVIVNLLLNGIEALSAPECSPRELVVQTSRDDGGAIRIAVRDSGGGIDEENMDRIFNAFFTTKAGGLGMGLSIVRSIVEAHGGRLWATNNPGGGATFLFTLPVSHGGST